MDNEKYELKFKDLGIEIKPLPDNYTPDSYAQSLLQNIPQKPDISYSANTNYSIDKKSHTKQ